MKATERDRGTWRRGIGHVALRPGTPGGARGTVRAALIVEGRGGGLERVDGFSIDVARHGLSVAHPSGQFLKWTWVEVAGIVAGPRVEGDPGESLRVLDLFAGNRHHRFVIDSARLDDLTEQVARVASSYAGECSGGQPARGLEGPTWARALGAFASLAALARNAASRTRILAGGYPARAATRAGALLARKCCPAASALSCLCRRALEEAARPVGYALSTPLGELACDAAAACARMMGSSPALAAAVLRGVGIGGSHATRKPAPALRFVAAALGAALVVGGISLAGTSGSKRPTSPHEAAVSGFHRASASSASEATAMAELVSQLASQAPQMPALAPATLPPAPAPPSLAGAPPLAPHEIFAFAPYWSLPIASGFDLAGLTTIAYFGVSVNANGTIRQSGSGWNGYQSQDLANLITRAHGAGDRVVLTAKCFSQAALDRLTSDPAAQQRLASELVGLLEAKNLDGVNLDFEGTGTADRAGLDQLVAVVSAALRAKDPSWQLTMDTYASSAGDPSGFYDIAGLAPSVNAFFVMGYDMNAPNTPSPTAPLTGPGFTDLEAMKQYTSVVPASKVILGVPFYGYQWPTSGPGLGDPATGAPVPVTYAEVTASGSPTYWDASTQTPWTSSQAGGQWSQTFFDNPTSLALKARLATFLHLRGLGIWALGMDGNDPAMLAALLGNAPPVKDYQPGPGPGPSATTTTTLTGPGAGAPGTGAPGSTETSTPAKVPYYFTGVYAGHDVTLHPANPNALPAFTPAPHLLRGLRTDDPALACLSAGRPLDTWSVPSAPGDYVVTARTPTDCGNGTWVFSIPLPSGTAGGTSSTTSSTTSPGSSSTSSTTSPGSGGTSSGAGSG